MELTRFHGHLILSKEGVLTFPRKPDSVELEVGRFVLTFPRKPDSFELEVSRFLGLP